MFSRRTPGEMRPNAWSERLEALRAAGVDLVDLTETGPAACGLTPHLPAVSAALAAAALRPYRPEPRGLPSAREALAAHLAARDGVPVDAAHLLLTASTSEAYGWLLKVLCEPGDAVLVPQPCYPLLEWLCRLEGVTALPYALARDGGFQPAAGALPADARVRAVLAVSPANPTGTVLQPGPLAALQARCAQEGWALVVDEVFAPYARGPLPSRASVAARPSPCLTFSLGGLSKEVGLAGLKLGWLLAGGPPEVREAALARLELVADTYLSVNGPVQEALGALLEEAPAFRARVRARLEENLAALRAARGPSAPWDVLPLEGGWSAVVRIPRAPGGEEETCLALLEAGVAVHPGHFFDFPPGAAYLVLSLLPPPDRFAQGVARLARVLG